MYVGLNVFLQLKFLGSTYSISHTLFLSVFLIIWSIKDSGESRLCGYFLKTAASLAKGTSGKSLQKDYTMQNTRCPLWNNLSWKWRKQHLNNGNINIHINWEGGNVYRTLPSIKNIGQSWPWKRRRIARPRDESTYWLFDRSDRSNESNKTWLNLGVVSGLWMPHPLF